MQQVRDDAEISMAMLEDAAEEVGIDRALVRRAAWEQGPDVIAPQRRLGVPTQVTRRRWLPQRLEAPALERLLTRLDAFFGANGRRTVGSEVATWNARHVFVTLEPQGDGTLVQISERFVNTANSLGSLGIMAGTVAGTLLSMTALAGLGLSLGSAALGVSFVVGLGTLGLLAARARHAALVTRAQRSFDEALASLELAASESPAPTPARRPSLDAAPES